MSGKTLSNELIVLALAISFTATLGITDLGSTLAYLAPAIALVWLAAFNSFKNLENKQSIAVTYSTIFLLAILFLNPFWSAWKEISVWLIFVLGLTPAGTILTKKITKDNRNWATLRLALLFPISILAASALFEFFTTGRRADAWLADANVAAAICNVGVFLALGALLESRSRRSDFTYSVLLTVLIAGSLAAFSRAGNAWLFAGLLFFLAICIFVNSTQARRLFIFCTAAASIAVGAIYFGPIEPVTRSAIDTEKDPATYARFLLWKSALEIYAEAPALGNGLGSFKIFYPEKRSPRENQSSGDLAHNDYLQLLAEGGTILLLGIISFALIAAFSLYKNLRLARTTTTLAQARHLEALALCTAAGGLLLHASVNFVFYIPSLSLLFGILTGHALAATEKKTPCPIAAKKKPCKAIGFGCTSGALLSLLLLSTQLYAKTALSNNLTPSKESGFGSKRYETALALSYLNPLSTQTYYYLIRSHVSAAKAWKKEELAGHGANEALRDIKNLLLVKHRDCFAQTMQAHLVHTYSDLESLHAVISQYPSATTLLEETIRQDPACFPAYSELAKIHRLDGEPQKAQEILNNAFNWIHLPIKIPSEWRFQVIYDIAEVKAELGATDEAQFALLYLLQLDPHNIQAKLRLSELKRADS